MPSKITVKCVRGAGDRVAPIISDQLIVTESAAVSRGKRFLDDPEQGGYYVTVKRSVKVPHKSDLVLPTKWIDLTDSHLGLQKSKMKVKEYTISILPDSVFATIQAERYEVR